MNSVHVKLFITAMTILVLGLVCIAVTGTLLELFGASSWGATAFRIVMGGCLGWNLSKITLLYLQWRSRTLEARNAKLKAEVERMEAENAAEAERFEQARKEWLENLRNQKR